MKNFLLFRFVPEHLLPVRLFRRAAPARASPLPREPGPERRERIRYVPMQIGSQLMPFIVDTGSSERRRDPYE